MAKDRQRSAWCIIMAWRDASIDFASTSHHPTR